MTNILNLSEEEFNALPFWQKDYAKKIEKMTWGKLLDEVIENASAEGVPNSLWYFIKSSELLTTRISDMEDELNAFHELHKLTEKADVKA